MAPIPPQMPKGETMSQSEVERLLAAVEDEQKAATESAEASGAASVSARLDFPAVSLFSEGEFRSLRTRHEDYIRSLGGRLSAHLRLECGLQMSKLETMRFRSYLDGLSNPTHLAVFRIEPLTGVCLLDIPPRLGLSIVDRELGGPGVCQDDARDLTKMETRLIARVIDLITTEWCGAWTEKMEYRPALFAYETCPRFVNTHPPDQMLLVLGMELHLGDVVEQMQMALPISVLEPLLARADADRRSAEAGSKTAPKAAPRWNPVMDDMPVRLTAEWHGLEVTAQQLGDLKPGDVLAIAPGSADRIQILLESSPKYTGNLGTAGSNWAVKIADVVRH